jgi:branched-subunit amino acid aminotransferase/4-amino-4-deoxychorismate lyase
MELAADEGIRVERRAIPIEELPTLREVAACGTAVVVTPVNKIVINDKVSARGPGGGAVSWELEALGDLWEGLARMGWRGCC